MSVKLNCETRSFRNDSFYRRTPHRYEKLAGKARKKARGKRIPVVASGIDVSAYSVGVTFRFPPTNPCFFPHFPPSYPCLILPALLLGQVAADTKDERIYACRVVARVYTPSLLYTPLSLSVSLSLSLFNLNHNCYYIQLQHEYIDVSVNVQIDINVNHLAH